MIVLVLFPSSSFSSLDALYYYLSSSFVLDSSCPIFIRFFFKFAPFLFISVGVLLLLQQLVSLSHFLSVFSLYLSHTLIHTQTQRHTETHRHVIKRGKRRREKTKQGHGIFLSSMPHTSPSLPPFFSFTPPPVNIITLSFESPAAAAAAPAPASPYGSLSLIPLTFLFWS